MNIGTSDKFTIVCQHKDTNASNLNKVFASFGCDTLEAKVPVVQKQVAEGLTQANHEQQKFGTLALKSQSATNYMDGRVARTKNRDLSLVGIGKDTMLVLGKERDRSPVDVDNLDTELERYMEVTNQSRLDRKKKIEAERIRLAKQGSLRARLFEPLVVDDENVSLSFDELLQNMKSQ